MIMSPPLRRFAIHRVASRRAAPRAGRGIAAIPMPSPATQYTARSFAQPIRRVFGTVVFRAREHVRCRRPGDTRPARLVVELCDPVWDGLYAPLVVGIGVAADRLNRLQFLTIRQLSDPGVRRPCHFAAGARDMVLIRDLTIQGAQMLLVLLLAPLLTGFVRKVKARLLRREGPPLIQPYRDLLRLIRKEVVLARERLLAVSRRSPISIFAATWVAASLVPTFRTGLLFCLVGRSHRHRRAPRQRHASSSRWLEWMSARASAASDRAAK